MVRQTTLSLKMTIELMMHRALFKLGKKYRVAAKILQQAVKVPQVAQAASQITIGEKVRDAVEHHVLRRQYEQPIAERHTVSNHDFGVRSLPRSQRQDSVMHIDHPVAFLMDQRRQFVHPSAVIRSEEHTSDLQSLMRISY